MREKALSFIFIIILCASLFGCSSDLADWEKIDLNCGTIKVPDTWSNSYVDERIYFYTQGNNGKDDILAFQSKSYSTFDDGISQPSGVVEKNAFSNKFQNLYTISSNVISNGTVYGEAMVSVDGTKAKMKYLDFCTDSDKTEVLIFVNDDKVKNDIYMQIAESFESF